MGAENGTASQDLVLCKVIVDDGMPGRGKQRRDVEDVMEWPSVADLQSGGEYDIVPVRRDLGTGSPESLVPASDGMKVAGSYFDLHTAVEMERGSLWARRIAVFFLTGGLTS